MAVSGSTNFSQTRNDLILDALSLIGCNSVGRIPQAADITVCNNILNKMVKAWQSKGLHLWTKEEGLLFLEPYIGQYDLGSSAKFVLKDLSVTTCLASDSVLGETSLVVKSTEGMSIDDPIGIVQDDGYIYWTTISSIPDSITVNIPGPGLPLEISSNQLVYSYSQLASKPLRILDARTLTGIDLGNEGTSLVETPLTLVSYQTYFNVGMTTVTSTLPNQGMYVPKDLNGRFYIWPRPLDASKRIQITYERLIDDLYSVNNNFDFPSEWLEPLTYQLAIRIASIFGKEAKAQYLLPMASEMLQNLLDWDQEITSLTLQPYYEGSGYSSYNGGEGWGR
jgi:hypothetical protein